MISYRQSGVGLLAQGSSSPFSGHCLEQSILATQIDTNHISQLKAQVNGKVAIRLVCIRKLTAEELGQRQELGAMAAVVIAQEAVAGSRPVHCLC